MILQDTETLMTMIFLGTLTGFVIFTYLIIYALAKVKKKDIDLNAKLE